MDLTAGNNAQKIPDFGKKTPAPIVVRMWFFRSFPDFSYLENHFFPDFQTFPGLEHVFRKTFDAKVFRKAPVWKGEAGFSCRLFHIFLTQQADLARTLAIV